MAGFEAGDTSADHSPGAEAVERGRPHAGHNGGIRPWGAVKQAVQRCYVGPKDSAYVCGPHKQAENLAPKWQTMYLQRIPSNMNRRRPCSDL